MTSDAPCIDGLQEINLSLHQNSENLFKFLENIGIKKKEKEEIQHFIDNESDDDDNLTKNKSKILLKVLKCKYKLWNTSTTKIECNKQFTGRNRTASLDKHFKTHLKNRKRRKKSERKKTMGGGNKNINK